MTESIKCILTGYKGQFEAIAKDKRICTLHDREIYTVESNCNTVSINVFATNVEHKNKQFLNGGWPVEFYYS